MSIVARRTALRDLVAAAVAPIKVRDDIPDLSAEDVTIVVTWSGSRCETVQTKHTFEVWIISSPRLSPEHFAKRDAALDLALTAINTSQGFERPTASTRTLVIGPTDYPLSAVITTIATDAPVST